MIEWCEARNALSEPEGRATYIENLLEKLVRGR